MPPLVQGRSSRLEGGVGTIFSLFWSQVTGNQEHGSLSQRSGVHDGVAYCTTDYLYPDNCVEPQDPLAIPGAPPSAPGELPPLSVSPFAPDLRLPNAPTPVTSALPSQPSSDDVANAVHRRAARAGIIASAVVSSFVGLVLILMLISLYLRHRRKTRRAPSDEFLKPKRGPERPAFPRVMSQYNMDAHPYPRITVPPPSYIRGNFSQPIFTNSMR